MKIMNFIKKLLLTVALLNIHNSYSSALKTFLILPTSLLGIKFGYETYFNWKKFYNYEEEKKSFLKQLPAIKEQVTHFKSDGMIGEDEDPISYEFIGKTAAAVTCIRTGAACLANLYPLASLIKQSSPVDIKQSIKYMTATATLRAGLGLCSLVCAAKCALAIKKYKKNETLLLNRIQLKKQLEEKLEVTQFCTRNDVILYGSLSAVLGIFAYKV